MLGALLAGAFWLSGCSGPEEVRQWRQESLEFTLEGPLFEGPNSGQSVLILDFPASLDVPADSEVAEARILKATVHPSDSLGFQHVRSLVLSFASDNAEVAMQEVAFKNPVFSESATVELDVTAQADLGELLAENQVYLVLDVDLAEDFWDGNRSFLLDCAVEITFK